MKRAIIILVILAVLLVIGIFSYRLSGPVLALFLSNPSPEQPIAFSHKIHAGDNKIPCLFCHIYANKSTIAGVPSVQKCVGCHQSIRRRNSPEIRKVFKYWEEKKSIPWIRVYDKADYIYFPHKRHVKAGVRCQECHGDVANMERINRVNYPGMGWCLSCHKNRHKTKGGPRGPIDCWECHI